MDIVVIAPPGVTGQSYSGSAVAENGTPPYAYSVVSGALPDGLTYDAVTGAITGVPTNPGTFDWTAEATDSLAVTVDQPIEQVITTLTIGETLPPCVLNKPYSGAVTATNGVAPYSFAITAGSLPPGLVLNGATGAITGTPTNGGSFDATVTVTDSADTTPNVRTPDVHLDVVQQVQQANATARPVAKFVDRSCTPLISAVVRVDFHQLEPRSTTVWTGGGHNPIPVAYAQYDFQLSNLNGNLKLDACRAVVFNISFYPVQTYNAGNPPVAQMAVNNFSQFVLFNQTTGQEYVFEPGNFGQNQFVSGQVPFYANPGDTISARLWSGPDSSTIMGIVRLMFLNEEVYPFVSNATGDTWGGGSA